MREIDENIREICNKFLIERWYDTKIIVRRKIIDGTKLDGFVIMKNNKIIGMITYKFYGKVCEIVSLDSLDENKGNGTALIENVKEIAKSNGCNKLRLITTTDNLRAINFYLKRGFRINKVYKNIMDFVRKIKPNVPILGENNIALQDEIEFMYNIQ